MGKDKDGNGKKGKGKGKRPKVTKNRELINAGEAPKVVRDINGKVVHTKTVGKQPKASKPSEIKAFKQLDLPLNIPPNRTKVKSNIVRDINGKPQFAKSVGRRPNRPIIKPKQLDLLRDVKPTESKSTVKSTEKAPQQKTSKLTPPNSKTKPQVPKSKTSDFKTTFQKFNPFKKFKNIMKGLQHMRDYLKKNVPAKTPEKSKKIVRRPPSKGR